MKTPGEKRETLPDKGEQASKAYPEMDRLECTGTGSMYVEYWILDEELDRVLENIVKHSTVQYCTV